MWRDSRKYGICLHAVTQSPALLPAGVRDACVNTFCFQLKDRGNQEAIDVPSGAGRSPVSTWTGGKAAPLGKSARGRQSVWHARAALRHS